MLFMAQSASLMEAKGRLAEHPGRENRPFRHVANAQHYQCDGSLNGGSWVSMARVHLTGHFT